MQKVNLSLIFLVMLVAACSPGTTVSTPQPNPPASAEASPPKLSVAATEVPQATEPPSGGSGQSPQASGTAASETPTGEAVAAGGSVTFHIIPEQSEVAYEVGEVFINQDNRFNVARGVTPQVSGDILVDRNSPQNSSLGTITVDISQFTSDSPRRDGALRDRFLESARYPLATFVPSQISGLPETYQQGEQITFQVSGDLTIRETTQPATFDVIMQIDGDTLSGEAKSTILMSDYGIGPISIAGILKTEDEINLTFTFAAGP